MKIFLIIIILLSLTINCYAIVDNAIVGASNFLVGGSASENPVAVQMITSLADGLFAIGIIVAIIVGLITAMKIMSDSSVSRADLKTSLFPYLVGCIVLIGGWGIWKAVVTILQGI